MVKSELLLTVAKFILIAQTWSDYKSHNTIKFLIGITPTGFISFLSNCYGGRANFLMDMTCMMKCTDDKRRSQKN